MTVCLKHSECMINVLALEAFRLIVSNTKIQCWQSSHIFRLSFFSFATLPNLMHQQDPSPNIQICAKSMARRPNLWHSSQIFGMAAKSVALRPNLWHSRQICCTVPKSVAWRPNLYHRGQICVTAAKSLARGHGVITKIKDLMQGGISIFCTAVRDVNVFMFQKNDRFVMKTTTKNRKRNELFKNDRIF